MAGAIAAVRGAGHAMPQSGVAWALRARQTLAGWAAAEIAPGRLLPWLPVVFGAGIAVYFAADREPAWWAASAVAVLALAGVVAARRHPAGFPLALAAAAMACGFATATLQTWRIAHPVMRTSTWQAQVKGFVEIQEERPRSDRIVVRVQSLEAPRIAPKPDRVRVSVRKGTAPPVGTFVAFKAHLAPPLTPLRPGGYDFARDMYFQQIGASGWVLGKISSEPSTESRGLWLRYATLFAGIRDAMDGRIRAILPGDRGSIASALITGKRDAISVPVNDAMYVSSLAHVLSISGYHMAVVAGIVFFVIRAALALIPSLAVRRPIKKWAAAGALFAATFYLLLSGSDVATQRSHIMISIVLIGVMLDRPAITFRTLSVAAFAVLILAPQALMHPTFQMSFAATLALVATYQHSLLWKIDADNPWAARAALWGGREAASLIIASLVAGMATTPYAAFHFHRIAPYGVLANLLAMPVVSVLVMPMGILGAVLMPLGLDGPFWKLMGVGLDWMMAVALWVAHLPGAVGPMPAFGPGALAMATAGILLICLLRSPLRWSGAVVLVIAIGWALATPRPDILIAGDGQTAAVRGNRGGWVFLQKARDGFAAKEWLLADGDTRAADSAAMKEGVRCDALGCTARLRDGRTVAFALAADAFEEDCRRAAVVAAAIDAPGDCAALVVDRRAWRRGGATALYVDGERFVTEVARPSTADRPWAPAASAASERRSAVRRPAAPDATPAGQDIELGD